MKTALRTIVTLAACVTAFTAVTASAQPQTPNIDQRQQTQANRIVNGQATGQLSNREAARLNAGQNKVARMEARAKADGKVTRAERKAIQKEQDKQSRRIKRQKHDGNKR
ncbi:MAG: hypothetical protein ABIZ64_02570 [Casimicrobium sp.]|jgi:uncharacterized membrane protein YebE (DUF533 family)